MIQRIQANQRHDHMTAWECIQLKTDEDWQIPLGFILVCQEREIEGIVLSTFLLKGIVNWYRSFLTLTFLLLKVSLAIQSKQFVFKPNIFQFGFLKFNTKGSHPLKKTEFCEGENHKMTQVREGFHNKRGKVWSITIPPSQPPGKYKISTCFLAT